MIAIMNDLLRSRVQFKWMLLLLLTLASNAHAARTYTPNDVYASVVYANLLADSILAKKNIKNVQLPTSREIATRPMHVYELHSAILGQLHSYALTSGIRPPPLAVSTPIQYTPTDVFYLTRIVSEKLEELHGVEVGKVTSKKQTVSGKTPADVYRVLFHLFYKLSRLNGKPNISPNEVYAHMFRAKEDLQYSLLTLSRRLDESEEERKILLVSAIYGMHPNGTLMPPKEDNKKPVDVIQQVFRIREKLNLLRQKNNLAQITIPKLEVFGEVKPIDVFLQVQFIIAELNLLKLPMDITTTTNRPKPVTGKTPSDVLHEAKHIEYMLDRLLKFNLIGK